MASNLRTGLFGSGDVDINVSMNDLNAANITGGTFDQARIPTLGNSKISDLDAGKLTGTAALAQIPTLDDTKISSLSAVKLTGTITTGRIPPLQASLIAYGELDAARIPALSADKISIGTFAKSSISTAQTWTVAEIPALSADKITSGTLDAARIPNLSAGKITSDTLDAARIPSLDATKITTGVFASADRIPAIPTSKITSGTFAKSIINSAGEWAVTDIPDLPASKIQAGATSMASFNAGYITIASNNISGYAGALTINGYDGSIDCGSVSTSGHVDVNGNDIQDVNEIKFIASTGNKITGNGTYKTAVTNCDLSDASNTSPSVEGEVLMFRGVASTYTKSKSVGTSYTTIDSHTQGTFTAPSSGIVEVSLSFYALYGDGQAIQARLVKGGTSTEFRSAYSIDSEDCVSTEGTYIAGDIEDIHMRGVVQTKWVLSGLTSGSSYAIDAQLKVQSASITVQIGSAASGANYPPVVLKVVSVPTSSFYLYPP